MTVLDPVTYTVTRRPGAWTDGEWTPNVGAQTTFGLVASMPQPVGPELIQMLPEAARTSARFMIFAEDDQPEIYLIENATHAADYVAYGGQSYLVTSAEDWSGMPLGHHAYILLEAGPDE